MKLSMIIKKEETNGREKERTNWGGFKKKTKKTEENDDEISDYISLHLRHTHRERVKIEESKRVVWWSLITSLSTELSFFF